MDSTVEFAMQGHTVWLRVAGRAIYTLAPRLADFIAECRERSPDTLRIDLQKCLSMDSTFIGILTKNVLRAQEDHCDIELFNTPAHVSEQIRGLGLARFFTFTTGPSPDMTWTLLNHIGREHPHPEERLKETMREAHASLGEANPENVERFRNVLDALKNKP